MTEGIPGQHGSGAQGIPPQGIPPQGIPPQGIPPQGIPGLDLPQQGISSQVSQDGSRRPLNVFFDVDNTLIMWNGKLRNHTRDVFQSLKDAGHTIYVWSGVGIRRWDMKRHDLDGFVTDYFVKPLDDHHARLVTLGVPMTPDFVIDDHKTVVDAFGGYHIPDMAAPDDDHLLRVLDAINEMATLGDVEEPGENVAV